MFFLTMSRVSPLVTCLLGLVVAALSGCKQAEPLPELSGGAEMALRRGSSWSTVKVRPPYAIGPRVNLHFDHGHVAGHLDPGMTMDSRVSGLNLTINDEGIQGSGPYGPVAVDVEESPTQLTFEGTWNGSRVHFTVTAEALKGSIPVRRVPRTDPFSGRPIEGLTDATTCQYVLDRVTADGAREGTSICGGLPEQTRLEIPRQVEAWLTRKEMVVVLLALFSTPPQTVMEPVP
jgi:hypothetical protein